MIFLFHNTFVSCYHRVVSCSSSWVSPSMHRGIGEHMLHLSPAYFCRLVSPWLPWSCLVWRSLLFTSADLQNGLCSNYHCRDSSTVLLPPLSHERVVIRLCTECNRIFFKGSIDCWTCSASTRCMPYAVVSGCIRWKKLLRCMALLAADLVVDKCSCGWRFW